MQIHYQEDGSVEIYSRNAERNTGKFPDVVAAAAKWVLFLILYFVNEVILWCYNTVKDF